MLTIVFSVASLVMVIPFLELLFGMQEPVYQTPEFSLSWHYVREWFYYLMTLYIDQHGKVAGLAFLVIVVIGVFFMKNFFRYGAIYMLAPIRNGIVRDLQRQLYAKTLTLPMAYFSNERRGDLIVRLSNDVREIEQSIIGMIEALVKSPVTILFYIGVMLATHVQLTLMVLGMLLVTGLLVARVGQRLKRQSLEGQNLLGRLVSLIDETLGGMRIIKAFNAEHQQEERFYRETEYYFRTMNRIIRRRDLSSPLTEFLAIVILGALLWLGGRIVLNGGVPAPQFIFIMVTFSQLIPPVKEFFASFYNVQKGIASVERINHVLHEDQKIREPANPKPLRQFRQEIRFEHVYFAYHRRDDQWILQDINLVIPRGKTVALVGPSGAGKTTLADLVPRFYDVEKGCILLDGHDIREYSLKDLRGLMGIVSQHPVLFNETIAANIAFGKPGASREEIIQAARVANAHDFIIRLEKGYDTSIGDQGQKLSGGERQRLTLARAVLRDPEILILDEATSSLDSESEKLVQEALFKLMKNRTSLVIAHRLSTIQHADVIVVMQEGRIVEQGNHQSLMKAKGAYHRLVSLQNF